jgi:hypothetical protein
MKIEEREAARIGTKTAELFAAVMSRLFGK